MIPKKCKRLWNSHLWRLLLVMAAVGGAAALGILAQPKAESSAYWLLGVAAVVASFVALFGDAIRGWIWRPVLTVEYVHDREHCDKPLMRGVANGVPMEAPCYYFRLRIKNTGTRRAEKVEVLATKLSKRCKNGTYRRLRRYSMNLKWTNVGTAILDGISPQMERFCDVGHIVRPQDRQRFSLENLPSADSDKTVLSFDLEVQPNHLSHLIEPGKYRLTVLMAASNHRAVCKILEIEIKGSWCDDMDDMLHDGICIGLSACPSTANTRSRSRLIPAWLRVGFPAGH